MGKVLWRELERLLKDKFTQEVWAKILTSIRKQIQNRGLALESQEASDAALNMVKAILLQFLLKHLHAMMKETFSEDMQAAINVIVELLDESIAGEGNSASSGKTGNSASSSK